MQVISYNSGHKGVEAHLASLISTTLERDMTDPRLQKYCEIINPALVGCKAIPLTHGYFTIVDEADYEWLNHYGKNIKVSSKQRCP